MLTLAQLNKTFARRTLSRLQAFFIVHSADDRPLADGVVSAGDAFEADVGGGRVVVSVRLDGGLLHRRRRIDNVADLRPG
jgi:hypothetical protein